MHAVREVGGVRHRRRILVAEEAHPAIAGREQAALDVVVELGEVAAVERELEPLLGAEQRALGAALLGDVAPDAAVAEEAAVLAMAHQPGDDVHLARAALVGARDLEVEERRLLLEVVAAAPRARAGSTSTPGISQKRLP